MKPNDILHALAKLMLFIGAAACIGVIAFASRSAFAAEDTVRIDSDNGEAYAIMSTTISKIVQEGWPEDLYGARVAVFTRGNNGDDQPFSVGFYSLRADNCTSERAFGLGVHDESMELLMFLSYTIGGPTWIDRAAGEICKRIPKA